METCGKARVPSLSESGGNIQRNVDEPTGNLDSGNAESLFDLFIELQERVQQTFIVVTHNEQLAQRGNHILQLSDGKLV